MNYDLLEALIPPRRLPDDQHAPRQKLHDIFRSLESLRDLRAAEQDTEAIRELDERIRFYENLLETKT